jgi:phage shock protein B
MPAIIIASILLAVLVPVLLLWLVIRLVGGRGSRGKVTEEDMRTVQEVYTDLARMEKRIETLETILLDRTRKG